jgi:hypothetical protein
VHTIVLFEGNYFSVLDSGKVDRLTLGDVEKEMFQMGRNYSPYLATLGSFLSEVC